MIPDGEGNFRRALAWFVFPLVPVVLGRIYHETFNLAIGQATGPDPRDWTALAWTLLLGPLLGYGFLAGATTLLDDRPPRRGVRSWLSRRAVWVALGPWAGFLALWAGFFLITWTLWLVRWVLPASREWRLPIPDGWDRTWWGWLGGWALIVVGVAILGYGWLIPAVAAVRRGRAAGRGLRVLERGVGMALAFTGSLFGGFWAITEIWRSYFFDKTIVPVALIALTVLTLAGGCGAPITYGEQRRRELFSAMLAAWLLGLALVWRWWSRSRPRG